MMILFRDLSGIVIWKVAAHREEAGQRLLMEHLSRTCVSVIKSYLKMK